MSAVVFLLVCFLSCSVSEEPQRIRITVHRGDDVTLPCKAPNVNIAAVEWIRSNPERLVYFQQDRRLVTADQDPSYVNRVQLKDNEMKNGDLSLILKNVTSKDEGTYKCRYIEDRGGAHESKLISIVYLDVKDQQETAKPGDDVILSCEAPNNVKIEAVKWSRSDLKRYVYFQLDRHIVTADQDPSYVNRVQLKDDEMKNGELSLILKNVTNNDEGTYVCSCVEGRGRRRKRSDQIKLISIVQLKVEGGDSEGGKDTGRGYPGVPLLGILNVLVLVADVGLVGFVIYKKRKGRSENNSDPPVDDPDVLQQLQEN